MKITDDANKRSESNGCHWAIPLLLVQGPMFMSNAIRCIRSIVDASVYQYAVRRIEIRLERRVIATSMNLILTLGAPMSSCVSRQCTGKPRNNGRCVGILSHFKRTSLHDTGVYLLCSKPTHFLNQVRWMCDNHEADLTTCLFSRALVAGGH
ncbi:hypothetical protein TNCV_5023681 [Trichonephila clavipes]|nr:hypothetical protein TNCV_5023681 [Trichonephila clavipes]